MDFKKIEGKGKEVSDQEYQNMSKEFKKMPEGIRIAANWWAAQLDKTEEECDAYLPKFMVTFAHPVQMRGISEKNKNLFRYALARRIMESLEERGFCLLFTNSNVIAYPCPILYKVSKSVGLSMQLTYFPRKFSMIVYSDSVRLVHNKGAEEFLWKK